jgi:type 1 glutamine amidotransferase
LAQVQPHEEKRIRDAAPKVATATPRRARTVLIWNTPPAYMDQDPHKGYSIPYGETAMRLLGDESKAFKPVVSGDVAMFLRDNLRGFDAIVLNNASGPWLRPTEADLPRLRSAGADIGAVEDTLRRNLLEWLEAGHGIVGLHYAIAGNPQWPGFAELFGAKFTGHPWNEEVGMRLDARDHRLTRAFDGKPFRIADEIYEFGPPYDRSKLNVLLSLDTAATNMGVQWITRKDGDFAQAWTKRQGKGRVFYCGFGHRWEVWTIPSVMRFYLDGIQWACGDLESP